MVRYRLLATVAALALTAGGTSERAEAADPDSQQLSEIIVTAQKRSEDLTLVPTSITVIGGNSLGSSGINDFDDLSRAVPGLSLQAGTSEGSANLQIRGVSSTAGDATVSIYLNETPISVSSRYGGATQPIPFDIGQVEVLRGPQGTLYGASSLGGTIRYIQNKPDLDNYGGFVTGEVAGTDHAGVNYETSALANMPIIDGVLAIRIGGLYGSDSGWIDNYDGNGDIAEKGVNSDKKKLLRFSALYQPSEDFSIQANTTYQRFDSNASSAFYTDAGAANSTGTGEAPYLVTTGLFKQSNRVQEWSHDTVLVSDVEVNRNLGFAELTSISSYFYRSQNQAFDGTYYNSGALANFYLPAQFAPSLAVANAPSPVYQPVGWDTWSQEVRLASPSDSQSPLKWVGGIFVSAAHVGFSQNDPDNSIASVFQSTYGVPLSSLAQALGVPANDTSFYNPIFSSAEHETTDQYAVFGQLTYDILPDLHVSAGLRYSFAHEINVANNLLNAFFDQGLPGEVKSSIKSYAATPRFSLSYDVNELTSIYTTEAKGFRLGGPAGSLPSGPGNVCEPDYQSLGLTNAPGSYGSDSLWSYEGGLKSTLADRSISINTAGYYIQWSRLQQGVNLPTCGFGFTANAGDAEIYGGELEVRYAPKFIKGLKLGITGSFNHAEITKTTAPFAQVGQTVEDVPERTATISADYDFPIIGDWTGFGHVDYDFTGHAHGAFQTYLPNYENAAYGIVNAQLGVNDEKWKIYLFAKNLLNDHTIYQQPTDSSITEGYTVRPLTVGISARRDF
jgi:outer membrane receptor protein involved in Fe transport